MRGLFARYGQADGTPARHSHPPHPESDMRPHLEGKMCPCTGHHNIVKAVTAASGQDVRAIAAE